MKKTLKETKNNNAENETIHYCLKIENLVYLKSKNTNISKMRSHMIE